MKRIRLWTSMLLIGFLAAAGVAAGGPVQQELAQESTIAKVFEKGVLRVGMDTFVPWAMRDKTGKLIGFEIDVATRLAEDLGVKVEFVPTKWSGIIPSLLTGKFDVIIGGMGAVPSRLAKVNFTIPYDYSGMSIVASKELAGGFSSLEDFDKPDVVLAAKLGATSVMAAKKYLPKAQIRQFDGDWDKALAAYNGGPGNVNKWSRDSFVKQPEDFPTVIPFDETREYITKVMEAYHRYQWLEQVGTVE